MTTPDARVAEIAAAQGGAVSRRQAQACGLTDAMIGHRLRTGRWRRAHPGVHTIAGSPDSWTTTLWSAYLAVGPSTHVSHETALLVHHLPDRRLPRHPVAFTVPHGSHPRVAGAVIHQIDDVLPHHTRRLPSGMLVSTPARAVVEVAATLGQRHLGDVVDEVIAAQLASMGQIETCFSEVARPGKPGMHRLAAVLDERGPGFVPHHSELERALFEALARGGLPAPRRQAALPGRGAIEGIVDAAYDDVRLVLEADGRRWHQRLRDMKHDRERDAEAARVGWLTLRFVYEQILGQSGEVAEIVRDVRATRSERVAA
jgi:very-short-patch-repair endonuclease